MDRRKHRTPFTARGILILAADGSVVATCETAELASFLCVTANFADELTAALQLCRGRFEQDTLPPSQADPAYRHFIDVLERWEKALRG